MESLEARMEAAPVNPGKLRHIRLDQKILNLRFLWKQLGKDPMEMSKTGVQQ